jgi:zinc transport system ATP-binding protein
MTTVNDPHALISADHICVGYGATEVLHDVSLVVRPGEILTILGPNGSGKSSLIRALLGIVPVSHGKVTRAPGLRLGYVPQKLSVDRSMPMTVRRFLSLPLRVDDAAARAALDKTGVAGLETRQMAGLSGGQFQRVLLARALLCRPQLLILDEPTQGLDQPGEAEFYQLIETLRQETGAAVLMVSHDLHVVMAASDRVICLNGHICCEGTPKVVSNAPEYRALFGLGTKGALALYQHDHDHAHDHGHDHHHDHDHHQGHHHGQVHKDHVHKGHEHGGHEHEGQDHHGKGQGHAG